MYYQSRNHQSHPVKDAAEAVHLIHTGRAPDSHAFIWLRPGRAKHRLALLDNSHIDRPWQEVILVNLDTQELYESITFAWIESEALKVATVQAAEVNATVFGRNIVVPLDGDNQERPVRFTCGCCGESFHSTIAEQTPFDQDHGFGICPAHAHHYAHA